MNLLRTIFPFTIATCLALSPVTASPADPPPNAAAGVKYIGSDQCISCHEDQHESFLRTLHSRAAQVTDISDEPKPDRFDHPPSGNVYEVSFIDGTMIHREVLRSESGEQLAVI